MAQHLGLSTSQQIGLSLGGLAGAFGGDDPGIAFLKQRQAAQKAQADEDIEIFTKTLTTVRNNPEVFNVLNMNNEDYTKFLHAGLSRFLTRIGAPVQSTIQSFAKNREMVPLMAEMEFMGLPPVQQKLGIMLSITYPDFLPTMAKHSRTRSPQDIVRGGILGPSGLGGTPEERSIMAGTASPTRIPSQAAALQGALAPGKITTAAKTTAAKKEAILSLYKKITKRDPTHEQVERLLLGRDVFDILSVLLPQPPGTPASPSSVDEEVKNIIRDLGGK